MRISTMLKPIVRLTLLAVTSTLFLTCGKEQLRKAPLGEDHGEGGVLRLAAQQPMSLDPIHSRNYWESEIVLQLFDSLLKFDANLNIVPGLAQDWHISSDGRTYTFNLRDDVQFHNGRKLSADDVVFSLSRLLDPRSKSEDAQFYMHIDAAASFKSAQSSVLKEIKAVDARVVEIKLEQPYAPFLRLLAQQAASIVPKEEVQNPVKPFQTNPVGTGAFKIQDWDGGPEIVLAANSKYYAGRPFLDQIRITGFPALNAHENFNLFKANKVDLSFVPADQSPEIQKHPDWVYLSRPILRLMYLGFNMRDRLLKNKAIRESIIASIHKAEVLGQDPDYSVVHNLIPFTLFGTELAPQPDPYNLEKAKELFRSHLRKKKSKLSLQLWHARVSENREQMLTRIADGISTAGFEVTLKIVPSMNELLQQIYAGKTQMFLLGEQMDFPDPDALLHRLFHSKSPANPFGYANARVDTMILEAQSMLDEKQRTRLYGEIEQQILQDSPILPLSLVKYSFVHHARLEGLKMTPLGFQYLPLRSLRLRPISQP